jgi:hypothetical protein
MRTRVSYESGPIFSFGNLHRKSPVLLEILIMCTVMGHGPKNVVWSDCEMGHGPYIQSHVFFQHCAACAFSCTVQVPQSKSGWTLLKNTRYRYPVRVQQLPVPSFVYVHLFFCLKVSIENKSKEAVFLKKGTVVTGSLRILKHYQINQLNSTVE